MAATWCCRLHSSCLVQLLGCLDTPLATPVTNPAAARRPETTPRPVVRYKPTQGRMASEPEGCSLVTLGPISEWTDYSLYKQLLIVSLRPHALCALLAPALVPAAAHAARARLPACCAARPANRSANRQP